MTLICPLRMLAWEGDWDTIANCGLVDDPDHTDPARCLEDRCAWWDANLGQCAVAALANTVTTQVVAQELRDLYGK